MLKNSNFFAWLVLGLGFLVLASFGSVLAFDMADPYAPGGLNPIDKLIGGQIEYAELCCNGIKIRVGKPNGGDFIYTPGQAKLYPYYNIFTPGVWVLGKASMGGTCQKIMWLPPCFRSEQLDGTIKFIGTSSL